MVSDITIMIVEDVREDRQLIKHHIKKMGFSNIVEAVDGESALKQLEKTKVDLIIADRYMSNMDGMVFYQKLQENQNLKNIPFLMTTAEHGKEKIVQAMHLGIRNYIIKPVEPENLQIKIKRLLKME